jgi:hypothetical protein
LDDDKIGALQELPYCGLVVVRHRRILLAEAFGCAQRAILVGDEVQQLSVAYRKIRGMNLDRFLRMRLARDPIDFLCVHIDLLLLFA